MNAADQSELLQVLQGRCGTIADGWYQAIARTSYVPHSAAEVRQHFVELTEQAIAFLLTDPLKHGQAEAIGRSLAHLHYIEPEALGRTQELLAQQLVQGLPADQVVALRPRLAALLGGLATGFFRQAREAILVEREQTRGAPVSDLQRTEGTLREARDKVEQRVQERNAELAVGNGKLRREIAEHRRAEDILRQGEEWFRTVADFACDWEYWLGVNGNCIYVSPSCERITGYRADEFLKTPGLLLTITHPDDRAIVAKHLREELGSSKVFPIDFRIVTRNGDEQWIGHICQPVYGTDRRWLGRRASNRDITKRKRAEETLARERNLLRILIDSLPDYIYIKDTEGRFVVSNIALGRHMGATTPDELIGKTDFDFYPLELATQYHAGEQEIVRSGQPLINREESAVDEATGEKRWHLTTKVPVRDSYGEIAGIVGITREITERRRMEEELLRSREEILRNHRLLLALSQAAQAVQRVRTLEEVYQTIGDEVTGLGHHAMIFVLADDRGYVTLSHTTFEPAWLQRVEELSGLSVLGFRFPLAPDGLFQRVIAEGESAFCECTAELVAKGVPELGRPLLERLIVTLGIEKSIYAPLRVSGEIHGLLGVASTDLTEADVPAITAFANQAAIAIENAQLLEQVDASRERLRRLTQQTVSAQEEERQRLSRALHDEAGQALTALKISLELIQEDLPVESGLLRQRIGDAAALTTTTMEQIRLLAQDLRPPALDAVGLGPTLEGFCRDFAKRTQLSIDYLGLEQSMLPEAVNICLYRFLQEALTNVAKHACANQVCVALRHDAETVSLSVEDDGRGFDGQARLSVSGWPMGIGLLGMQERLESLGGRLEIESWPDQGTRLAAHIPAGSISWEESR